MRRARIRSPLRPATFLVGRDGRIKSSRGKPYRAIERELKVKVEG